jgi:hypothetical protein
LFCFSVLFAAWDPASPGQTLHVSRTSAGPGEWVTLEFFLKSPVGREPSALQWEAIIPYRQLMLLEENLAGPMARAAGKSLSCAIKSKTDAVYTSICMLFGGQERIRNGPVALLRLRLSNEAQPGIIRLRIAEILGVMPDARRISMQPVETLIRIQKK